MAHTLGNPFDADGLMDIVREHGLFLIEDCCDALGSGYKGHKVGTFGQAASFSFYPAHHITLGEGGAVVTNSPEIARAVKSLRAWGRDCSCGSGENDACRERFSGDYGRLPHGYDHKYVYSHIGYNLKATDMQAAIGVAQMKKLPDFFQTRKDNFPLWQKGFERWTDASVLPRATPGSDPAWFAYPLTVKEEAGFTRTELTNYLDKPRIETSKTIRQFIDSRKPKK